MGMLDYLIHRTAEKRAEVRAALLAGEVPLWVRNSKRQHYIAQVLRSCPDWVSRDELRAIQDRARAMSEMSGVPQHVCHSYPLNHPRVCGLTVPWNLEVRPALHNLRESNHCHLDDQLSLFG